MRRAAKRDDNEPEMVELLRKLGWSVQPLNIKGVPDLLLGKHGINKLAEIKDGAKPPSKRKLTTDQEKWHENWKGQKVILETIDDVVLFNQEAFV